MGDVHCLAIAQLAGAPPCKRQLSSRTGGAGSGEPSRPATASADETAPSQTQAVCLHTYLPLGRVPGRAVRAAHIELRGCGRWCAGEAHAAALLPTANLSNKLNPNNVHYDREAAVHYKTMGKADKEALWAHDRVRETALAGLQARQLYVPSELGGPANAQLLAHHASLEAGRPLSSVAEVEGLLGRGGGGGLPSLGSLPSLSQRGLSISQQQSAMLHRLGEVRLQQPTPVLQSWGLWGGMSTLCWCEAWLQ